MEADEERRWNDPHPFGITLRPKPSAGGVQDNGPKMKRTWSYHAGSEARPCEEGFVGCLCGMLRALRRNVAAGLVRAARVLLLLLLPRRWAALIDDDGCDLDLGRTQISNQRNRNRHRNPDPRQGVASELDPDLDLELRRRWHRYAAAQTGDVTLYDDERLSHGSFSNSPVQFHDLSQSPSPFHSPRYGHSHAHSRVFGHGAGFGYGRFCFRNDGLELVPAAAAPTVNPTVQTVAQAAPTDSFRRDAAGGSNNYGDMVTSFGAGVAVLCSPRATENRDGRLPWVSAAVAAAVPPPPERRIASGGAASPLMAAPPSIAQPAAAAVKVAGQDGCERVGSADVAADGGRGVSDAVFTECKASPNPGADESGDGASVRDSGIRGCTSGGLDDVNGAAAATAGRGYAAAAAASPAASVGSSAPCSSGTGYATRSSAPPSACSSPALLAADLYEKKPTAETAGAVRAAEAEPPSGAGASAPPSSPSRSRQCLPPSAWVFCTPPPAPPASGRTWAVAVAAACGGGGDGFRSVPGSASTFTSTPGASPKLGLGLAASPRLGRVSAGHCRQSSGSSLVGAIAAQLAGAGAGAEAEADVEEGAPLLPGPTWLAIRS